MKQEQINLLLKELKKTNCKDEIVGAVLQLAADSVTLETLKTLLPSKTVTKTDKPVESKKSENYLKFTKKEISRITMTYKNIFAAQDVIVRYRKKPNGVYEARYHREGLNIEVSSKDLTVLKAKFIEKLNNSVPTDKAVSIAVKPTKVKAKLFKEVADEWLTVKQTMTKASTCKEYGRMLKNDILPVFGEKTVTYITREELQKFLLGYVNQDKLRTADKLHLVLRCIFDVVADDYNVISPMKRVVVLAYTSKSGEPLTYEEERQIVNHCFANLDRDTSHALLVLLYFGLRKSELASIEVEDDKWLQCETSKERKGRNVVKRKIPFTPMVRQVLPYIDFKKAKEVNLNSLQTAMKRVMPIHHLHELRHTFVSRCKEAGVTGEVVSIWAGHSLSGTITTTVYTHYSKEFQLKEAEKVNYLNLDLKVAA